MPKDIVTEKAEMMEAEDMEMSAGSLVQFDIPDGKGLREWAALIEYSWEHEVDEGELVYSHVTEIFKDHVIVCKGYGPKAKYFMVPYMVAADGEVEFDLENKSKVKLQTEWVTKAAKQALLDIAETRCVKALADDRVGGFAVVWGSKEKKDIDDQWFTKDTGGYLDVFKAMGKLPWLFHHAGDGAIKSTVIGEIDKMEIIDDIGIWYESKIIEQEMYKKYVSRFVKSGRLFSSSGALPNAVKASKDGQINFWPIVEVSGTWKPADYHQMDDGQFVSELKAHYKSIGIDSDELFATEDTAGNVGEGQDAEEAPDEMKLGEIELAQMWLELQSLNDL